MQTLPEDISDCFEKNGWGIRKFHGQTHIFLSRDLGDKIGDEKLYEMCIETWTEINLKDFGFREMIFSIKNFYKNDTFYSVVVPPSRKFIRGKPAPDNMLAEIFVYRVKTYGK